MKKILSISSLILCFGITSQADVISLKDGTKLVGNITSADQTSYSIQTQHLGVVILNKQLIANISFGPEEANTTVSTQPAQKENNQPLVQPTTSAPSQMSLNDIIGRVSAMQNDPSIQRLAQTNIMQTIISNPTILKAIENKDYTTLSENPDIIKLMNSPEAKQVISQVLGKE